MKKLLLPVLLLGLALPVLANPTSVTTTKRSAVAVGNSSFALIKGTKLEVVSREGDILIVKYRTSQGKIPVADTDYPVEPSADAEPAEEPAKPLPAVAKQTAGQTPGGQQAATVEKPAVTPATPAKPAVPATTAKPATATPAKPATAPALNTTGTGQQPATNYGKAVQKAKQASEANKSTHVEPTKDILEEPKK